jgi:hypothetical protein
MAPKPIDGFSISIAADSDDWNRADAVITIGAVPSVRLSNLTATLVVSPKILARVDDEKKGAELAISAALVFTPSQIVFDGFKEASLKQSYLAGTKLKISADGLAVENDARSGGSAISMKKVTVELPADWISSGAAPGKPVEITGERIRIGPSGISGKFVRSATDVVEGRLFGWPFQLRDCQLELQDNAILSASLTADVHLKQLDKGSKKDDETWIAKRAAPAIVPGHKRHPPSRHDLVVARREAAGKRASTPTVTLG